MQTYDIKNFLDEKSDARFISFKKGEVILTNGEIEKYFYIIIEGKIKTYQLNLKTNKKQTIFILRNSDMFDVIVLLDGKPHDVMYEVLEDVKLVQMPIESVRKLLSTNQEFNKRFFPYIAKQIREIEELATDLSLYSTSQRLIKLILQNLDPKSSKYNLINSLSNTEIANMIGTVRQVVERHLKELQQVGIIKKKNIIDTKKLLKKINFL